MRSLTGYFRIMLLTVVGALLWCIPASAATPFPISVTAAEEIVGGAAYDGTHYLVAIRGNAIASAFITAQMVSSSGALVGGRINVGRVGGVPNVAFDGTRYLLVWEDATTAQKQVMGQFISTAGTLSGTPFTISTAATATSIEPPTVTFDGTNYLVTWCYIGGGTSGILARFVSTAGNVLGDADILVDQINFYSHMAAVVAFDGTRYLVAYHKKTGSSTGSRSTYGRFISTSGILSDIIPISQTTTPNYSALAIAFDGTDYLVAWNRDIGSGTTNWDINGRVVSAAGTMPGDELPLVAGAGSQVAPMLAWDGSRHLLSWLDLASYPATAVNTRYFTTDGTPDEPATVLATNTGALSPILNPLLHDGQRFFAGITYGTPVDTGNGYVASNTDAYGIFFPDPPPAMQPDVLIRTSAEASYAGDNVYNDDGSGQTKAQSVAARQTATYYCRIQNDGETADSFTVTGPAGSGGWAIGYVNNATGAAITGAVTSAGWNTGVIAPGQYVVVIIRAVPSATLPANDVNMVQVQACSQTDAQRIDQARAMTTFVPQPAQPDLLIRTSTEASYAGDNIFNTSGAGQTKAQSVASGATATYYCRIQNDGTATDSFTITGPAGGNGWAIGYVNYATNTVITNAVTGNGWSTGDIAPGQYTVVVIRMVPTATVAGGNTREVLLQATSQADTSRVDCVKANTMVTAVRKPDLLIRTSTEASYAGDNVYNTNGAGQTKAQSVATGATATYYCRVQNDGNATDSFTITGPAGSSGWAVGYVNYATNAVITGAVTGAGWSTGSIAPGQYVVVVIRMVPSGAVSAGASKEVIVQAASVNDAQRVDAVQAVTTIPL